MVGKERNKCEQHLIYNIIQWGVKGEFYALGGISDHVKLFRSMISIGNINNSLSIVGNFVFDSNYKKYFPLSVESLNLICSSSDGEKVFSLFRIKFYAFR